MPHAWFTSPGRTGAVVAAGALAALVYSYARRPAPKIAVARGRPSTTPRTEARPDHPYPYDVFPGGRDVATPYGTIRVYEFGPESGAKVLLMHGIGTPCVALGDMARQFVRRGCRVMLFGGLLSV